MGGENHLLIPERRRRAESVSAAWPSRRTEMKINLIGKSPRCPRWSGRTGRPIQLR